MAKKSEAKRPPKVRIVRPGGRPYQLRYKCPDTGRQVRVSTGSRDDTEAEQQRRELEAKLVLGMDTKEPKRVTGPSMPWGEFREEYTNLHLAMQRDGTAMHAESRLDIAERIMRPRILADMASAEPLHQLQAKLLAGAQSTRGKPRSPHTVRSYMGAVLAAVNWAYLQGWIETAPKIRKLKIGRLKHMKGRPITLAEFNRMLDATGEVVGKDAAPSWQYLLRGAWNSALRLGELLHVSWDIDNTIRPMQRQGRLPVLMIPGAMQKNATEEAIPLLTWFEDVLMETPPDERTGWVFNPMPLQRKIGRAIRKERLKAEWVGRVITRIGERADVTVDPGDPKTGRPTKYASAMI